MIRIVVGSASILKLEAVQEAIDDLGLEAEIVAIAAESGQMPQPYGRAETVSGAEQRARAAREAGKGAYAVGIENGLVPSGTDVLDYAYIVVFTPEGRRLARRSVGVPVPQELVDASRATGYRKTAGALEAERSRCDPADPHHVWSRGQTNRKQLLYRAIYAAMLSATVNEEGATS